MGNVGSKSRSLGQIIENPFVHNTGLIFQWIFMKLSDKVSIFMKLHQNICLDDISMKFEYGSCQVKN